MPPSQVATLDARATLARKDVRQNAAPTPAHESARRGRDGGSPVDAHRMIILDDARYQRLIFVSTLFASWVALGASEAPDDAPALGASESSEDGSTGSSEEPNTGNATRKRGLEEIEVRGERTSSRWILTQPQAVDTLTQQELNRNTGLFLEDSLNLLPGVRMVTRTVSGGQRITIRGYQRPQRQELFPAQCEGWLPNRYWSSLPVGCFCGRKQPARQS